MVHGPENKGVFPLKRDNFFKGNESSEPSINFQGDMLVFRGVPGAVILFCTDSQSFAKRKFLLNKNHHGLKVIKEKKLNRIKFV